MGMAKIQDAVVVITGASSGIGREAALEFARRGATVVLGARREQPLREVAERCRKYAGRALAVPMDVTDEDSVQALARAAIEDFGRIDVWVNNAAVTLFSRFEEAPPADWRRVLETNLFGYVHGARAAIPYLREQGHGIIINNLTGFAMMGAPYLSAYITSKFALRGLTECLREELLRDGIQVCAVLPASIDTPLFQHAANYTGRAVKPLRPVIPAQRVARAIVQLAKRPRSERVVGRSGMPLQLLHSLARPLYERLIPRIIERDHFQDRPAEPTSGNLWRPMLEGAEVSGGWTGHEGKRRRPARVLVGTAALAALGLGWLGLSEARARG
jgi:NAD(P)-dependent dehydrogenase (short-subunit alcohol dehydrogenase family)